MAEITKQKFKKTRHDQNTSVNSKSSFIT